MKACAILLGMLAVAAAQAQTPQIETIADGLEQPWAMAELPDGRWLITEAAGQLLLIDPGGGQGETIRNGVPAVLHGGQAGLFDVLLDKDFASNQRLYLSYACGTPSANHTCMASARLADERLLDTKELFRSQPAKSGLAHFGGRLLQLPDATLLLSLGDGFDWREQAQNTSNHLGAVVRLQTDGNAPADNPFVDASGHSRHLYSYGHRNVQGLVWDAREHNVLSHEHGPRGGDELNRLLAGSNYGWPLASHGVDYTGALITPFTEYPGTRLPLWHWTPSIAPSDMRLYQAALFPDWQGDLLITSLAARRLHRLTLSDTGVVEHPPLLAELDQRLRAVRVASDGSLIILTDGSNASLLRLTPTND